MSATPPPSSADAGDAHKKPRSDAGADASAFPLDDDVLFEVLGRADARSLARAACVSRHWRRLTRDERLWEIVCTRHWTRRLGASQLQLRSTVLAVGGFRRLHSLYILPLVRRQCLSASSSSLAAITPSGRGEGKGEGLTVKAKPLPERWGKDEIMLSMSLMSAKYYRESIGIGKGSRGGSDNNNNNGDDLEG